MWSFLKEIAEAMVDAWQNPVPDKFDIRDDCPEPVSKTSRVKVPVSAKRAAREDSVVLDPALESHDLSPPSEELLTPKAKLRGKAQKAVRESSDLTQEVVQEVMDALMSLGYKKSEARVLALDAVNSIGLSQQVEVLVKYALKTRGRGPAGLH